MQSRYNEFNGDWHKDCRKCNRAYGAEDKIGLEVFFTKDSSKTDGLDVTCKQCRKNYRLQNKDLELKRWKRNYRPGTLARTKHVIRSQTRRKYGSASLLKCVCGDNAKEWHHIKYQTDSVVALCEKCHERDSKEMRDAAR